MTKKAEQKKCEFKPGDSVRLKNEWALKFGKDGLAATVKEVRISKSGDPIYLVEAQRPSVPLSVMGEHLE